MRKTAILAMALCAALPGGCATSDLNQDAANRSGTGNIIVRNEVAMPVDSAYFGDLAPAAGRRAGYRTTMALSDDGAIPAHCSLRDRFDRGEHIAYNFADGQSRLGLKLGIDGFDISDPGDFELQYVKLRFRYRFEPIRKRRERCLYNSAWQGLGGSLYNELIEREEDTIYEALDDKWDNFRDRF